MADDKIWVLLSIPAIGDMAAWVDEAALDASGFIEVDNLTRIVAGPNGKLGFMKMMDRGQLSMDHVAIMARPNPEMNSHLSRLWDTPGKIIPINGNDLKSIRKLPHD